ncbi:MAG: M1 family peptidase, partial [Flavobacteriales bacterium]|nr:M1 family peptidase [Flavobacteriales bacterium]
MGHTDQAYYITQWYPKPAVFDAQGWHAMPYLTLGEFYSEFGSFDVSITLPANYVVGATGELRNAEEHAWMDSLAARPLSISISKGRDPFPPSDPTTKTIRFLQDSVHDFAWFADKRFQVRKSSVTL